MVVGWTLLLGAWSKLVYSGVLGKWIRYQVNTLHRLPPLNNLQHLLRASASRRAATSNIHKTNVKRAHGPRSREPRESTVHTHMCMCMFKMNLLLETQPNEGKAKGDAISHKSETLGRAMLVRAHAHHHRSPQCSRGAQRVLRYGDMEYVMLHLIFSLPHAWGGTTCSVRCLRSLIPERILLVAHYQPIDYPC